MQEPFINSVLFLKDVEVAALRKRIGGKSIKLKLIDQIRSKETTSESELMEKFYPDNRSAFYALKHRLIDDIVELKVELKQNAFSQTRAQIENLRLLLYSENYDLLEKRLTYLERKVKDLDIYSGPGELYFYFYLYYYNDPKKRSFYSKKIEEANERLKLFSELELNFFNLVFQSLDCFYAPSNELDTELQQLVRTTKKMHDKLSTPTSEFMWLSSKLTIELTPDKFVADKHTYENLLRLKKLYNESSTRFTYMDCDFAIDCLINRYHFLNNSPTEFKDSLDKLKANVHKIKSYRMYENVYFYFLYIYSAYLIQNNQSEKLEGFLSQYLDSRSLDSSSPKILFYYYYLLALALFYNGKPKDAHSYLLKARELHHVIEQNNAWIVFENYALSIIISLSYQNPTYTNYEIIKFKKLLYKYNASSPAWKEFRAWVKLYMKDKAKAATKKLDELQKSKELNQILKLVDLEKMSSILRKR